MVQTGREIDKVRLAAKLGNGILDGVRLRGVLGVLSSRVAVAQQRARRNEDLDVGVMALDGLGEWDQAFGILGRVEAWPRVVSCPRAAVGRDVAEVIGAKVDDYDVGRIGGRERVGAILIGGPPARPDLRHHHVVLITRIDDVAHQALSWPRDDVVLGRQVLGRQRTVGVWRVFERRWVDAWKCAVHAVADRDAVSDELDAPACRCRVVAQCTWGARVADIDAAKLWLGSLANGDGVRAVAEGSRRFNAGPIDAVEDNGRAVVDDHFDAVGAPGWCHSHAGRGAGEAEAEACTGPWEFPGGRIDSAEEAQALGRAKRQHGRKQDWQAGHLEWWSWLKRLTGCLYTVRHLHVPFLVLLGELVGGCNCTRKQYGDLSDQATLESCIL